MGCTAAGPTILLLRSIRLLEELTEFKKAVYRLVDWLIAKNMEGYEQTAR